MCEQIVLDDIQKRLELAEQQYTVLYRQHPKCTCQAMHNAKVRFTNYCLPAVSRLEQSRSFLPEEDTQRARYTDVLR